MNVHFSSEKDEWETPQDLFDELNREFGFDVDVCATRENAKCDAYIANNSLELDWFDPERDPAKVFWMNPPYGRQVGKWVKKAYEESQKGATVVCLLAARTDTKWFHDYCVKGEVRFIKGRLKFGGAKNAAPFPSMIVVFRQCS